MARDRDVRGCRLGDRGPPRLTLLSAILSLACLTNPSSALHFSGGRDANVAYARYPKWNACVNASLSFEFKTRQVEGLLMYTDDRGAYDFVEMAHTSGRVRVVLNIVDGHDRKVQLDAGRDVNDGRWHRVQLHRNRMETTLTVDGVPTSRITFGSDFVFGHVVVAANNDVFFGGLPDTYTEDLHALSFPSALFQPRFVGSFRNILYGNCSCPMTRAEFVEGVGVSLSPPEACTERNPCRNGCICRSSDEGPECDCSQLSCVIGEHDDATHYELPMDILSGTAVVNPSGLDATAVGAPTLIPGVEGNAIRLHTPEQYVTVSGPSHRQECFGDLDKCPRGYTIALWVNFEHPVDGEEVFLSNGGHTNKSHGVAMIYNKGRLEFRFRRKNGEEWRAHSDEVLPGRWYHLAATWEIRQGLSLYVDGVLADHDPDPEMTTPAQANQDEFGSFLLGRPNDDGRSSDRRRSRRQAHSSVAMDKLNFWSSHRGQQQLRQIGPIFRYYFPMEMLEGTSLPDSKTTATIYGNPSLIRGKVGRALRLDGRMEYVDGGDVGSACLGDLQRCNYGLSLAFWVNSFHVQDNMYYLDSGGRGVRVYYKEDKLIAELQQGNKHWQVEWPDFVRNTWYFLEISWSPEDGARLYANLQQVAHDATYEMRRPQPGTSRFYIGRANTAMVEEKYAQAYIDEVEIQYVDRPRALALGLINRGRPAGYEFPMEAIDGATIGHPEYSMYLTGSPQVVKGQVNGAVEFMQPSQYASLGEHRESCLGNLDYCPFGVLLATWVRFSSLEDGRQYMSTGQNGLKMWYEDGNLTCSFATSTRQWRVSYSQIDPETWYFVEYSWHPDKGIAMYVNQLLVATSNEKLPRETTYQKKLNGVYLARGETPDVVNVTSNVTLDELAYYYADRDYLTAFGYLDRGRPTRYLFAMDSIENGRMLHPSIRVDVYGNARLVPGMVAQALYLDGESQYLDLGDHNDSCLGNLLLCRRGVTGALWVRFPMFAENMHYLSTGSNGANLFYKDGRLRLTCTLPGRHWATDLPPLTVNEWHLLEFTWHRRGGLAVYVDDEAVASDAVGRMIPEVMPPNTAGHVYLGRANAGFSGNMAYAYGDFVVDEFEMWEGRRDDLIAFSYIDREEVEHIYIPFEVQHDNEIRHPLFRILVYNGAKLEPAKVGNGVDMNAALDQYTTMGNHQTDCFGNLEKCPHGITMKMQIFPKDLRDNQYFLSSGPYSMYYSNGRLYAKFSMGGKTWTCSSSLFRANQWQNVELTWHEQRGLQMYINGREVSQDRSPTAHAERDISDWTVYLGRPNEDITNGAYANAIIDEMELWYAHKDFIDLWQSHVKHDIIDMDQILAGNLVEHDRHQGHNVYAMNSPNVVRGWIRGAIQLNGINQYINGGPNCSCRGNLDRCYNGFTLRARIKPNQLQEGMYLFSSAAYDIYYRNGKIWADFRTPTHKWSVSSNAFPLDTWSLMEWSWHPTKGLYMYVNGKELARDTAISINRGAYSAQKNFYVGRANTDMRRERYGRFTVDDVQLWEAYRDILIDNRLIDPDEEPSPGDVRRDIIDMDRIVGDRVAHDKHQGHYVRVFNRPSVTRGWINGAVRLDGVNQYINVGGNSSCDGSLDNCHHGFTLRSRVLGKNLQEGQYLYSSNMYDVYYRNGKLWCEFHTPTKTWTVSTAAFQRQNWNLLEHTWHPTKGLKMYVNGRLVAQDRNPTTNRRSYNYNMPFYIGRSNIDTTGRSYAQFTVDDVQLWEAWRDYLVKDGLINPDTDPDPPPADIKKDIIDMDHITGNTIVHENKHRGHYIYALNRPTNVQGWIGNAVGLDGVNQFINAGKNTSCSGNLATCRQGFTLRSRIKPKNLVDNMYLFSSTEYDIYYRDGKIWAEFRTPEHVWRVSSGAFDHSDWNLLEWTWHPDHGLIMYANNQEVARSGARQPYTGIYDYNKLLYIGRANTDMKYEKYGQFVVDDVQLYEAYRQYLIEEGLIDPNSDPPRPVGDVEKDIIDMDQIIGNRIIHNSHPGHFINVYNVPRTVSGWKGNAVRLNSRDQQYISLGANATCGGNLERCRNGFLLRSRVKPASLQDNMYWYSSAPYDIYYSNGRIHAEFRTPTRKWKVSSSAFNRNNWNLIDFSWHPVDGLIMYVDGTEVARASTSTPNLQHFDYNEPLYIGRANTDMLLERYGDLTIDDVQLWQAKRDILISLSLINGTDIWRVTTPVPTTSTTTPSTTTEIENYIVFDGTTWILYNMNGLTESQRQRSNTEEFMIEFKTTQPNGLLWWAGTEDKNFHLSLKNGQLMLIADHGNERTERFRVPHSDNLADGNWHTVTVTRNGKHVVTNIDGNDVDRVFNEEPTIITNGAILVGGYQDPRSITDRNVRRSLDGYVKAMTIRTDHLPWVLDLFQLYEDSPRQSWVVHNGLLPDNARSRPEPVTFKERGSYLRLPTWDAEHEGVIKFKFRTVEPDGLLLYNGGPQGRKDFFSMEMYDGIMYFIINRGDRVYRFQFSDEMVNDGAAHTAKIERSRAQLALYMDDNARQYVIPGPSSEPLDLDTFLYVGGVDMAGRLPWHLWSRQEKYYLGCLWDLQLNSDRPSDLVKYIRRSRPLGVVPGCHMIPPDPTGTCILARREQGARGIDPGCQQKAALCIHRPCAHGRCYDTWNGAVCDCAGTVYTGDKCQLFANVATFDGTDFLRLTIDPMMRTHTDDISLRFKTKKQNGLLFATDNRLNHEYIKALVENGHGKIRTNLGGRMQMMEFGRDIADDEWHTLYIRRRANKLEVWVDDNEPSAVQLLGEDYTLDIDKLHIAAMGTDDPQQAFAGWMQNFILNKHNIFDLINELPPGWDKEGNPIVGPTGHPIPEMAVTLTHPMDSYATFNTLDASEDMEVSFMFKTREPEGLLLYNGGNGNQFIAIELVDGRAMLVVNDGQDTRIFPAAVASRLDDDKWHFVKVKRVGYSFTITVDQATESFIDRSKRQGDRLDLAGALYIGGMPRDHYNRLPVAVQSRHGFRGCLASVKVNGRLYNLLTDSIYVSPHIKDKCTATGLFCQAQPCQNRGICLDGIDTFICDCNMTAYEGRICTDEPEGFRIGKFYRPGVYVYTYDEMWDSKKDSLALGFMTWYQNGTIARIDSDRSADFVEVKMLNGHVVVDYNIGAGTHRLVEESRSFNDGKYHVVIFERVGQNATFRVDSFPSHRFTTGAGGGVQLFNDIHKIKVGGNIDSLGNYNHVFNGIIAGLYYNGLRGIDADIRYGSVHGIRNGDVAAALHPFFLPKPSDGQTVIPGTAVVTPVPSGPLPGEVPPENRGGGAVWQEIPGGGGSASAVYPGGGGAGAINVGTGGSTGAVVSPLGGAAAGVAEGGRAAAVAGTFIGALLLASSLIYALYKLKPGVVPCLGAGGKGAGGKGGMSISAPHAATNYQLIKGSGGAAAGAEMAMVEVANGAAAGGGGIAMASSGTQTLEHGASMAGMGGGGAGGGATSQTQAFAEYFSQFQQSSAGGVGQGGYGVGGGAGGGAGYGTMTRAIQTDYMQQGGDAMAVAGGYDQQTLSQNQQQQQFNTFQQSNSYSALDSYQTSSYMQNTLQADHSGAWQMQHMALGNAQNLATLAAEEIRVDCLLMTSDGKHVVTGSIYGPPQTWDLGSGELVRIMSGEELSSTDLHLACNDTLLVGQVAEMTQVDPGDPVAASRVHNRKLQIWDFLTGRPLEMEKNELCTASCMMSDGERIVLGRTEKFGGGTTIVIYDLLANEPVRTLRYEAAVGFADFISYLNLSKDNRYVVAGFQNSYDGNANFILFDLTADSYSHAVEPKLLALDACAECTAILDNHEAVTGTRNGELIIWSMRTGKPLRQLVSATGGTTMTRMGVSKSVAHAKEVKAVCVSRDGKLLVSASSDTTLKVWSLESERQLTSLKGHSDEVWCCTISNDNDIVVSGSRDGTIRLWRLATSSPICVYNTGVDVFSVRMSSNKRTIVALGDKFGARKLIMLRVVVTKTRSRAPSRATSPYGSSRPTSPLRATSPLVR